MNDNSGPFLGFVVLLIISIIFSVGWYCGVRDMRRLAVEANVGYWSIDTQGYSQFKYGVPNDRNVDSNVKN